MVSPVHAGAVQGRADQRAHRAGSDDESLDIGRACPAASPKTRCRRVDPDLDDGPAGRVDAGLGVGPLADPQGLLQQIAQHPSRIAGALGRAQRLAHLAEDLALADGHRVEPADDGEQVRDRPVLVVHVEVLGQVLERHAGGRRQRRPEVGQAAVEGRDIGVQLDPVAGGQGQHLADVLAGPGPAR